ncbi:zinc ribbon domain-containing protein [Celerinatantimonas sp. YJH-8]|uniref:zinc ribbon domain-containing protein n=1 Tax=Celerinatantimonas sp. YJH-8 TaxID=3228714 RepID=UPI0038CA05FF
MTETVFCCPDCEQPLSHPAPGQWRCDHCHQNFKKEAYCSVCQQPLQVLQACGAVNYFCNHCNELKSKRTSIYRFHPM